MDQSSSGKSPRVGVYICHCGGNISDVVNIQDVVQAASKMGDVCVTRDCSAMCSQLGQDLIVEDIQNSKLNRVVVAACSPSLHEKTFRAAVARAGGNPYQYEHVNIREQVSWCSKANAAGATDKAIRLVGAGVAKVRKADPLAPIPITARKHVTVIGGGISGLRAACDLARAGMQVALLERSPWLGGNLSRWSQVYPDDADPGQLIRRLVDEGTDDPNISVYRRAEVTATSGCVGDFTVDVRIEPRGVSESLAPSDLHEAIRVCPVEVPSEADFGLSQRKALFLGPKTSEQPAIDWTACTRCGKCVEAVGGPGHGISLDQQAEQVRIATGAIVLATGFDVYRPADREFGYGQSENVVTLAQLERLLDPDGPTGGRLERGGTPIRSVCFIHCVGSRQIEGVHQPGPDGKLNEYCSRVCCSASLRAANEIRHRFSDVHVFELYRDIRSYGRGQEDSYDAAGRKGVLFIRYPDDKPPTVRPAIPARSVPMTVRVTDTLTFGEELELQADLVVLATAMVARPIDSLVAMLKLPRSSDGFLQEVHLKLRPVELAVGGLFLAGTCQAPMDIGESCAAGSAAAAKAVGLLASGQIQLDPYRARVDVNRCHGEGKCVEACEHQKAIELVEHQEEGRPVTKAEVNVALCTGCGMCVAACPNHAIEVDGWHVDQFDAMVEALTAEYV